MDLVNQIFNLDCLEFLKQIEDKSVAFSFSDVPYNVKKDYGVYKDDLPPEKYIEWMQNIIAELRRISEKGFAIYVGSELSRTFGNLIPDAHHVVVHKRAVGVMKGNYFLQYHSLFVTAPPVIKCKDVWDDIRLPGEGYFFKEQTYNHPGLTAEALVRKVLQHFTEPGDLICDPFMGTGTTAVAAKSMGRLYTGSELNPKYIEIGSQRLLQGVM
jgi:DNA modification methylase